MKLEKFPKQIEISGMAAWDESEIDGWIFTQIESRDKKIIEEKMKHILPA